MSRPMNCPYPNVRTRLTLRRILLKGAHALIECIGGLVLAFVSTSAIPRLVNALTQEELVEDHGDLVATHL
jgi:uncharacterized membrane protein